MHKRANILLLSLRNNNENSVPTGFSHQADWDTLAHTTQWIRNHNKTTPWFAYQGFNIVHPAYETVDKWFNAIDDNKITVPEWPALADMHPCSFQSSMLKGCVPSLTANTSDFYSKARRHRVVGNVILTCTQDTCTHQTHTCKSQPYAPQMHQHMHAPTDTCTSQTYAP